MVNGCVFCEIVAGRVPCHRVWEDERHLAFLSIFPNTDGFTVVIPKQHLPSYVFSLEQNDFIALSLAARQVGLLLDRAFDDVGRTAMMFEGFGVDHVHAKLVPLHGTRLAEWRPILSSQTRFFSTYEGFISSHDCVRADDTHLSALASRIRNAVSSSSTLKQVP